MGAVAFFPWFTTKQLLKYGRFTLFPHEVGAQSKHSIPSTLDAVFSQYRHQKDLPIRRLCVLQLDSKPIGDDFTPTEREDFFEFVECLAISALASRRYFTDHVYSNRDTFAGIIQNFTDTADGGVAVYARRRDGRSQTFWPKNFVALSPPHVHPQDEHTFDDGLLTALLKARKHADWNRFDSSIYFFNRSNTDNDQVSIHSEVVHSVGAFEYLLSASGEADKLAAAVETCLKRVAEDTSLPLSPRLSKEKTLRKYPSVRHLWARDMYYTRNSFAHGSKVRTRTAATWTAEEHLLMAAYVFPLCLKVELAARKLYRMTDADDAAIFAIDRLLRLDDLFGMIPFDPPEDDGLDHSHDPGDHAWRTCQLEAASEWHRRTVAKDLKRMSRPQAPPARSLGRAGR